MPNWVDNELHLIGYEKDLNRLILTVKNDTLVDEVFDFDKVIPRPKELDIDSGSKTSEGLALIKYLKGDKKDLLSRLSFGWAKGTKEKDYVDKLLTDKETVELGNKAYINLKKYGYATWYEWDTNNWGTKWNANNPHMRDIVTVKNSDKRKVVYDFATAWSPPCPVILTLSSMFPFIECKLKYWEGGSGFKGIFVAKKGIVISDISKEYNGSRGG